MSKITVTTIAGQTSGSDANKVKIESGDTLEVTSNATVGGTLGVTGKTTLSDDVGIGTTSPNSKLTSQTASTSTSAFSFATQLNNSYSDNSSIVALGFHNRADVNADGVGAAIALSGASTPAGSGNLIFCIKDTSGIANTVAPSDVKMTIDNSGRVTEPLQPSFLAKGANNAYITTSPIPFPTVSGGGINAGAHNIGGHYNTSNYTFTAPIAGRYFFYVHLGIVRGGSATAQMYPTLLVNGTGVAYSYAKIEVAPTANHYLNCSISQILSLAANDAVKVNFSQSGTGSYYNGPSESSFMGYLLG